MAVHRFMSGLGRSIYVLRKGVRFELQIYNGLGGRKYYAKDKITRQVILLHIIYIEKY